MARISLVGSKRCWGKRLSDAVGLRVYIHISTILISSPCASPLNPLVAVPGKLLLPIACGFLWRSQHPGGLQRFSAVRGEEGWGGEGACNIPPFIFDFTEVLK